MGIQSPKYMWQKCPHCNKPIEIILQDNWNNPLHLVYLDPIATSRNTLALIHVMLRKPYDHSKVTKGQELISYGTTNKSET